jgi:WD40 repeat protein/serine/threonine protein kinase
MNELDIFSAALELKAPEDREKYLDRACGDNVVLRERIKTLLRSAGEAGSFIERPVQDIRSALTIDRPLVERPGTTIGPYKLLQQIGEGGMGVVFMAEQMHPVRRTVALKIIKPGMDTRQVVARFEAERQALALMDHPNIAKVLDAGTTEAGRPYFVMEMVKGVPITKYCDDKRLTLAERLQLFMPVCQAVQHAHQKGIIHRDLKPSNVMIALYDGQPVPKVIDFGVAKATGSKLTGQTLFTEYGAVLGTLEYMSPEQAELNQLDIDTRSDIYSLGVLLYELLTGSTPLDRSRLKQSALDEVLRRIREEEPPKPSTRISTVEQLPSVAAQRGLEPSQLTSAVRGELDWIVMKALEKDRNRRYATANGLLLDIERYLADETVQACPPSPMYRFRKFARRNRTAVTTASIVLVTLVCGVAASTFQAVRATRAERAALANAERARVAAESERKAKEAEATHRKEAEAAQRIAESEKHRADEQMHNASESQRQSRRLLYTSDINLAQQALSQNNLGKARRLLNRHRPQPGEEDLRGWEWRYLWQLTGSSALVTLTNRPARGYSVSFSPDGGRLAVGWYDGEVELWDVPSRRLLRSLTDREEPCPYPGRVAFSPVRNLLAATSRHKIVTLYDLDSGQESILWRAPDQARWDVRDIAFSQDGSRAIIYAGSTPEHGDAVWVVNVATAQIESHHPAVYSYTTHCGSARLSPDNQRLYLSDSDYQNYRYSIRCLDLATGEELWQSQPERDFGLAALDLSPDGKILVSSSGFEDTTIRIWDAATGQQLDRLEGHTAWVCKLVFSNDGRHLISAASDQSIRFWDTSSWTEVKVLRGHTDEVHAVAYSAPAQLVASASKDGDLTIWKDDGKSGTTGYRQLPEDLRNNPVVLLDDARAIVLPDGKPPRLMDLKHDSAPSSLTEIGDSVNFLGCFGTNLLCYWNAADKILLGELRGEKLFTLGAISVDSGRRPIGFAFNPARRLAAWSEEAPSSSVYLVRLEATDRRIELKTDVAGLVGLRFNEEGTYLAASTQDRSLRVWNVESGQIAASINEPVNGSAFAADGRVLVVAIAKGVDHEIAFYDLAHPDRTPRRIPGRSYSGILDVAPDGGLVASSAEDGQVRVFDANRGELIESLHGHSNAVFGLAFSNDGRRLISAAGGREAVKLWDVSTRQELLTLSGAGSLLDIAQWTADGDAIVAGPPWQAWQAPSWAEIATVEAQSEAKSD